MSLMRRLWMTLCVLLVASGLTVPCVADAHDGQSVGAAGYGVLAYGRRGVKSPTIRMRPQACVEEDDEQGASPVAVLGADHVLALQSILTSRFCFHGLSDASSSPRSIGLGPRGPPR